MSGKRVSLASLAAAKIEAVPGAGRPDLVHVHPDTVAPTPLNPRRNFDPTELAELGQDMRAGQLQPCVAVSKTAYLKLYPEHTDQLPEACRYVMAAGERRWRAALDVGLDSLDVLLRHDLTESRIRFLSAVLSENVQRANFNPIEEANGLRAMLELHNGNQSDAAKAMGKSKQWFSQRIGLLRLTDEMVQLVLDGKLTAFREMRRYAAMPADEQYAAWKTDQERPPAPRPAPSPSPAVPETPAPQGYTAVYPEPSSPAPVPAPESVSAASEAYTAVYTPPPPGPASGEAVLDEEITTGRQEPSAAQPQPSTPAAPASLLPEARTAPAASAPPADVLAPGKTLPYDDGIYIAQHLDVKMKDPAFIAMLRLAMSKAYERNSQTYFLLLEDLLGKVHEQDPKELADFLAKFGSTVS
ncbi:ParB/RepB/Spo0J family partition protein [Streptomyces sp. NPDC007074]|uniref:ParB/RepB/Spo0J family partition protein n=1 Tax=Streptomyces sp. NPDC007074 TaxID=3156764 RepID=UPI0034048383